MSSTIQAQRMRGSAPRSQLPGIKRGQLQRNLRTLKGQFIGQAGLILLLTGILTLVAATSLSRATDDLNTINSGSIPSVDAAQSITQYIEVIDAQAADFLAAAGLTKLAPCSIAGLNSTPSLMVHDCDARNIDAETVLVNQQLFEAAHNVTYPGEQTAVERITIGLESYLGYIHQMRADYDQAASKTDPNDKVLQQAYQAYLNAGQILHGNVSLATIDANQIPFATEASLPSCTINYQILNSQVLSPDQWTQGSLTQALDCLSYINYSHLSSAYNDSASFLTGTTWLVAALCLLFCGLLLFGTGRMMTTTHRFVNPGLVIATLIAVILSLNVVALFSSLGAQSSQAAQDGVFKQMVVDDYNSVYFAALLNRFGTDANADESRWLIAREFNDQANGERWQTDWNNNVQQIEFLMQKAHGNQTWEEEIQPLTDMDTYWGQYHAIDGQIRSTAENQGDANRVLDAEFISTGKSNQAFGSFTDAVGRLSQANRDHYNATLSQAQGALMLSFVLCLVLFPLAGLLAVWGIGMRLKDF